jgi:hypothetical protein
MGEAKRRKLVNYCDPQYRADIARAVRSVNLVTGSGTCFFRAAMGARALAWLGLEAGLVALQMVYRTGPHLENDVLAFIGSHESSWHSWLVVRDDLVDFSVGDWRQFEANGYYEQGRIREWTAPPLPDFWWRPLASFYLTNLEPDIGAACYRASPKPEEFWDGLERDCQSPAVEWLSSILHERIQQLMRDWRNGSFTEFPVKTAVLSKPLARHGLKPEDVIPSGAKLLRVSRKHSSDETRRKD